MATTVILAVKSLNQLSFIFFVMYTAQRISYFIYSTHYVTWLDNFEMLCNFTRKEENLGMSNLRKRTFYLGIICILRNFNYSTRYSISAYTSNGVLLDGLIDETIISAVTYQLHLHKSIQDPEEAKALLDDQVGNLFWFYTVFSIKSLVWNLLLITCWNKISIT